MTTYSCISLLFVAFVSVYLHFSQAPSLERLKSVVADTVYPNGFGTAPVRISQRLGGICPYRSGLTTALGLDPLAHPIVTWSLKSPSILTARDLTAWSIALLFFVFLPLELNRYKQTIRWL